MRKPVQPKPFQPKSVQQWLRKTHSAFADLVEGLDRRAGLLDQVKSQLPSDLAPHCTGAEINNGKLKLFTSSSVWATRLRFCQDALLTQIQSTQGTEIQSVQVRVIPQVHAPTPKSNPVTLKLSQNTSDLIKQSAEHLDQPLRDALNRLASHK